MNIEIIRCGMSLTTPYETIDVHYESNDYHEPQIIIDGVIDSMKDSIGDINPEPPYLRLVFSSKYLLNRDLVEVIESIIWSGYYDGIISGLDSVEVSKEHLSLSEKNKIISFISDYETSDDAKVPTLISR